MGGLRYGEAKQKLGEAAANYQATLTFNGSSWKVPSMAVEYELDASLNSAYSYGRRLEIADYFLLLINRKNNYPLILKDGTTDKLNQLISEVAGMIEIAPVEPTLTVTGANVQVANGEDGVVMNTGALNELIRQRYNLLSDEPVMIPTVVAKRQLSQDQLGELEKRATKLAKSTLVLTYGDDKITLTGKDLVPMLATDGSEELINQFSLNEYIGGLAESIHKEPQDARFAFEGGKVQEFAPGKDGVELKTEEAKEQVRTAITALVGTEKKSETVALALNKTPPQVTTDKVNELGIRERIGRGESYYAHSIPNRIYNVGLAASRANSALIAPGEEFSFNKIVGEISGATGYRSAYVISGGRTVLGDGGGVCQVSTTLFRGAMSAGLPITERWAHAYRVGYYEQNSKPGIDATVYAPSKDLRFLNDTPGHILVQTINDPKTLHLVVEIYGTSDGRVATISEPKVWGISAPLPTVYQDDPSLPTGTMKQVDWSAPGAKASFEYKVVRNGEVLQDKTFTSAYRPWAAVYLKGTGI